MILALSIVAHAVGLFVADIKFSRILTSIYFCCLFDESIDLFAILDILKDFLIFMREFIEL